LLLSNIKLLRKFEASFSLIACIYFFKTLLYKKFMNSYRFQVFNQHLSELILFKI
jgi:hypothetical protein